jgi:hypothetical protein
MRRILTSGLTGDSAEARKVSQELQTCLAR